MSRTFNAITDDSCSVVAFPNLCPCLHRIEPDGTTTVLDYWHPVRTGNWGADCASGRRYGRNVRTYMVENKDPIILARMVERMVQKGEYGGVEIGFFTEIGVTILTCPA